MFELTIKLSIGSETMTARIVDGTVVCTSNGSFIDPGSVIPDLSDYTQLIATLEAAAETIEDFEISASQITGTRYKIIVSTT